MTPKIQQSVMNSLYDKTYFEDTSRDYSYEEQTNEHRESFKKTASNFKKYIDSGEILDIGCATGAFLEQAHQLGFSTKGVDPSAYAVKRAKEKGLDVKVGGIEDIHNINRKFDGIHFSHVLEHLEDPKNALRSIHKALKPSGILYLEVPNQFNSILSHFPFKKDLQEFNVFSVHHRCFFSCRSLTTLLNNNGFEIIEMTTVRREKRSFGLKRKLILNGILSLANIFKKGDLISVWARPKAS